jgi:hypothetical protein
MAKKGMVLEGYGPCLGDNEVDRMVRKCFEEIEDALNFSDISSSSVPAPAPASTESQLRVNPLPQFGMKC